MRGWRKWRLTAAEPPDREEHGTTSTRDCDRRTVAEELRRNKELLVQGIITEEEYRERGRKLLGYEPNE